MYKNYVKTVARDIIWKHAIETLTVNRNYSTIVSEKEIYLYWEHLKSFLNKHKILSLTEHDRVIKNFLDFRNSQINNKKVQDIKILFFCGPEPENDIEVLLQLGILEENIWAVELDKTNFSSAINIIKHVYPSVKIFKMKIENLFDVIKTKFDVVYLDYTAPFFSKDQKPYKSTIELFKNNILNDFGVLVTNYSEINPSDNDYNNNIQSVYEYFNYQTFVHELTDEVGTYLESPYINYDLQNIIQAKHKEAYSSFLTHFHLYLSEIITPAINIFNNQSIKQLLFNTRKLNDYMKKVNGVDWSDIEDFIQFADKEMNPESYWFEHFTENIKTVNPSLYSYIVSNKLHVSISYMNILKEAFYENDFLNQDTFDYLVKTQQNLLDPKGGYFCDAPMIHLWIALVVNQLGSPYHVNLKNHLRFRYIGNTREMYVDIYTLDKCRYFYDWIPSYNSLPETMLDVGKQLLIRIIIDIIRKQHQFYLNEESYQFGNLLCYNDDGATFLEQYYLENRTFLSSIPEEENNRFIEMFNLANYLAKKVENNYCASFKSIKIFHKYTESAHIWLEIKNVPDNFKVFGTKFNQYKISENYNFKYDSTYKRLWYKSSCTFNGDSLFKILIHKTIQSIFLRYGLDCELIEYPD